MNQDFIGKTALQAACIAISSRIVGSAFRCLETLNPNYQQSQVISNPKSVCIRELSTISMAFVFSLITNVIIFPRAKAKGWSDFAIQFLTAVIGTTIAESLGRLIAYRKAPLQPRPYTSAINPQMSPTYITFQSKQTIPVTGSKSLYMSSAFHSSYPFN